MSRFLVVGAALLASTALSGCAALEGDSSGDYPDRSITVIFPFAAGSPGDVNVRALAKEVEPELGQSLEIVNKEGAAGTAGMNEAASAESDGYTAAFTPIAPLTIQPQISDLNYESIDDFEPVIGTSKTPQVLSVAADSPYKTLKDLIAAGKKSTLKLSTTGRGTILDIDASLLAQQSGASFSNVPFDGEQQALGALVGGTTDLAVSGTTAAMPFEKSGDIRVLGVFSEEKLDTFPDAPTIPSLGYDITFAVDNFVLLPKGTDPELVDTLHDAFKKGVESDAYAKFLTHNGYVKQYLDPDDLDEHVAEQYEQYTTVIEDLDLDEQ